MRKLFTPLIRLWNNYFGWLASPRLEGLAHLATAIAVIIGVFSLFEQNNQFSRQVALQRELAISDRWQEHMRNSIDHPQFSRADVDMSKLSPEDREKYIWFVEDMIYSSERILQYAPHDPQWINTIIYEMRVKKPYILSDDFLGCTKGQVTKIENCSTAASGTFSSSYCTYMPDLRLVIRRAFEGEPEAKTRLNAAESYCHWDSVTPTVGVQL